MVPQAGVFFHDAAAGDAQRVSSLTNTCANPDFEPERFKAQSILDNADDQTLMVGF
jgi:hypothetical protein